MKTLKTVLFLSLLLPIIVGCSAKYVIPENATIDAGLVGQWQGKHFVEKFGYWKKWLQTRKSDGSYTLHLKVYDNNEKLLKETVETGYWWIQKDLFYEISPKSMNTPEVYHYHFVDKDKVKFSSLKRDPSSAKKAAYSFVDSKVPD